MKNSSSCSETILWNSLPPEMQQADGLKTFRLGCKNCPNWFHTVLMKSGLFQCTVFM